MSACSHAPPTCLLVWNASSLVARMHYCIAAHRPHTVAAEAGMASPQHQWSVARGISTRHYSCNANDSFSLLGAGCRVPGAWHGGAHPARRCQLAERPMHGPGSSASETTTSCLRLVVYLLRLHGAVPVVQLTRTERAREIVVLPCQRRPCVPSLLRIFDDDQMMVSPSGFSRSTAACSVRARFGRTYVHGVCFPTFPWTSLVLVSPDLLSPPVSAKRAGGYTGAKGEQQQTFIFLGWGGFVADIYAGQYAG